MEKDRLDVEKTQEFGAPEFLADIPAGVYWADNEGKFLYCNKEAADILGYDSPEELMQKNIYDLYFDPKKRDNLLDKMRKKKGRMKAEVVWKRKNGLEVFINEFAEFIHEDGEEAGVCGIFIDATYEKLFDDLNAGIYRIGPDMYTVQRVNTSVARMFGFKSPEDMEGEDIRKYYKSSKENYSRLMEYLEKNEKTENFPFEMKRIDGEPITVSVSCRLLKDDEGKIVGMEGTFTNITEQKKYEKLLEQPLGIYEAKLKDKNPIISFCNETFVKMFGYTSKNDMIGMNIYDLYANKEDIPKFEKALREADQKGESVTEYKLKVRKKEQKQEEITEEFWIEIFCYPIRNEIGEIIGRKGTIRDVTDKLKLEKILEKKKGMNEFIQRSIAKIISIHVTTEALKKEVERRTSIEYGIDVDKICERLHNTFVLCEEIRKVSENLMGNIEETMTILEDENVIDEKYVKGLFDINYKLEGEIRKNVTQNIIGIRKLHKDAYDLLFEIHSLIKMRKNIKNSRKITELIHLCLGDLEKLEYLYLLYLTENILNKSKIVYHDVEGLYHVTMRFGGEYKEQPLEFECTNIVEIIEETIAMYQIDAFLKGIAIEMPQKKISDIEVAQEPIKSMFSYIVENAVKYSFKREGYIHIELRDKGNNIQIDVENYGIGIPFEEIEGDKIFKYGFRGKFSRYQRMRGSGIGLSEAKRIVEAHGGNIRVISIPVDNSKDEITHDTPHKTIVSIILPKKQKR